MYDSRKYVFSQLELEGQCTLPAPSSRHTLIYNEMFATRAEVVHDVIRCSSFKLVSVSNHFISAAGSSCQYVCSARTERRPLVSTVAYDVALGAIT